MFDLVSEVSHRRPTREEQRPPRPEIDEVAPGILRLQLPISFPGLGHVNCYLMEDERGVALVDPGLPGPGTWRHLKKKLKSIGVPITRVHTVVVTHSHPDHFGQAGRFRRRCGSEIISHRYFRTFLDPEAEADDEETVTVFQPDPGLEPAPVDGRPDAPPTPSDGRRPPSPRGPVAGPLVRETPWGGKPYDLPLGRRVRYRALRLAAGRFVATPRPTRRVDDADVLEMGGRHWVSVHTPGHTEDHLCLWDPDGGVMISGDHVLPTITPHISGLTASDDPLADFFESLERMKSFAGVQTVLPAHGLAFADLASRADDITRHHRERLRQLQEAGDRIGQGTVEQYMKELFKPRSWGPMAESETYAHLQHLVLCDQADLDTSGSQLRYRILD
jgi:glyoxylase-like metal-dependent hydrolase (beta-lactamase superfamily II)